jgi:hypothetical protein
MLIVCIEEMRIGQENPSQFFRKTVD